MDWKRNKHKPTVPIVNADLTTEAGQKIVWELVQQEHVMYVHLAPPCGTYTRARERPIPKWQLGLGAPNPQPLRSDERPEGLAPRHMTPLDSLKVQKGNEIANFCAKIANYCLDERKLFSIENPSGSLIWEMPDMKAVCRREGVNMVDFHACMWGSSRDKRTTFMTNSKELESLRKQCNHQKWEHTAWGLRWDNEWKFATQEECEYPKELCNEVARAISKETRTTPTGPPARRKQKSRHGPLRAAERAAVGSQSRRHPRPEAVPERKRPVAIPVLDEDTADEWKRRIGKVTEPVTIGGHVVPAGARIMRVIERRKFGREGGSDDMKEWTCEVEMPWSESGFFALATGTPHPMEAEPVLSDRTKRAIFDIVATSRKE